MEVYNTFKPQHLKNQAKELDVNSQDSLEVDIIVLR